MHAITSRFNNFHPRGKEYERENPAQRKPSSHVEIK